MTSIADRVPYLPFNDRPRLRWPNDARVAFWVVTNVEHYEYAPPPDGLRNPWPRTPLPDVQQYSAYDYGNRVGFWRLLDVLDDHGIRSSAHVNIGALERFPELADAMLRRDWAFVNHGFYNTRFATSLPEEVEREFLLGCRERFRRLSGRELLGQSGPAGSSTGRTPDLAAEAGFLYQTDWKIDDQPVPVRVRSGRMACVPYTCELNDGPVMRHHHEAEYFVECCKAQFDQLYREGEHNGMVMCVGLHPYVMGRPHRAKHLADLFSHVLSHPHVWHATSDEIARHYLAHGYDDAMSHARVVADRRGGR